MTHLGTLRISEALWSFLTAEEAREKRTRRKSVKIMLPKQQQDRKNP